MKSEITQRAIAKPLHSIVSVLLLLVTSSTAYASGALQDNPEHFSAEGYRITEFRAPVPDSVPAGTTITTEQLHTLIKQQHVVLIDVMPTPVKPKDRPDNLLWLPPARQNIPESHWLPNVGYGALSDELDSYFRKNLQRFSNDDKGTRIVLYCLADCWMSWNAAKRAATEYGYTNIYWYPDGTTGWDAADLPLEESEAIPMQ
ncbi:MAG: PQQ-dependent catabolism-associated CXXCW motif protein [Candidatus Thiodiazotropha endolucinida]|uniref:Rhodanese-like domain protein n=1 Tax=Candidatus Thiodiazotropha endolucinida TaxID=1655433 RepID=A0A7Z0VJ27_9GAMM|nr:PQQ-dependent catabolism-associated CXXCW motif protein [Candidatus Thiodiazotropha endolucinida]MCG7864716.1 PQQ-dependent catabolism-associated CXXCW motif protein [Candidatus Thiodiazotropha endolucinida]ODJ86444.1 rhodanese-like domain protein [Candidatus Thiodiazotropha endolucinida]